MKHLDKQTTQWIKATLSNDEYSTDEEMIEYFKTEGKLTDKQARKWVAKRNYYLNNIVMEGGEIYEPARL